jgi:hypothetical protein
MNFLWIWDKKVFQGLQMSVKGRIRKRKNPEMITAIIKTGLV